MLRETEANEGVPYVSRWTVVQDGKPTGESFWEIEFPDAEEWECCRMTDYVCGFRTWSEAIEFALARSWEH